MNVTDVVYVAGPTAGNIGLWVALACEHPQWGPATYRAIHKPEGLQGLHDPFVVCLSPLFWMSADWDHTFHTTRARIAWSSTDQLQGIER